LLPAALQGGPLFSYARCPLLSAPPGLELLDADGKSRYHESLDP
jgi:hypothetical protein